MIQVDEEPLTEETPLVSRLTSPGTSIKSSSFASLSHLFPSAGSLVDEEHSAGILGEEITTHLFSTKKQVKTFSLRYWLSWINLFLITALAYVTTAAILSIIRPSTTDSGKEPTDFCMPFSTLDPIKDLNLGSLIRSEETSPSQIINREKNFATPTNEWYQNMLLVGETPSALQRVYSVPYILDVVGPIPGIQIHPTHTDGSQSVIQLSLIDKYGLTLGSTTNTKLEIDEKQSNMYSVLETTPLGITLIWNDSDMASSIVRGMPYVTMIYPINKDPKTLPAIASRIQLKTEPIADGKKKISCGTAESVKEYQVKRELQMTFWESDFTWIAFFSEPVLVQCITNQNDAGVVIQFQAESNMDRNEERNLIARLSLLTSCTTGINPLHCKQGRGDNKAIAQHADLLRKHSGIYPGSKSTVRYSVDNDEDKAVLTLDWDPQYMYEDVGNKGEDEDLIAYALPHQLESLKSVKNSCTPYLLGQCCIVAGSKWELPEELPPISFYAERPPSSDHIVELSNALKEDLTFQIPGYFMRGAGDTYFSGKILAKVARVLLITEEIREICTGTSNRIPKGEQHLYEEACMNASIPTSEENEIMLHMLRESVEIWLNGTAETPFVYDSHWGGLVSCGCYFDEDTESCRNKYPNCPVANDPGLDFGNGFYNDHHFHYGYHIYAAAVVAKYDPSFGQRYFQEILLFIRDIANPSLDDTFFPLYRHMDWYTSHSWASGISLPPLNGRNQESSSEAIAAYEAIALFGSVMVDITSSCKNCLEKDDLKIANTIRDVGRLLTATEIKGADRYWHVRLNDNDHKLVPDTYGHSVIGIIWNTMAQFQTWFGSAPYLAYGIQMLPLTPISAYRDDTRWLAELYKPYAESCEADRGCEEGGWSVLQLGILAAVGHMDLAKERCLALSADIFTSAGGNGHSRSNTLWYISTRPNNTEPITLPKSKAIHYSHKKAKRVVDCAKPETCTDVQLGNIADGSTCRDRINWLMEATDRSEYEACDIVAGLEFPEECGGCKPDKDYKPDEEDGSDEGENEILTKCQPCSEEICNSDLNRCPVYAHTFLCTEGPNIGGCQGVPWDLEPQCLDCCELSNC